MDGQEFEAIGRVSLALASVLVTIGILYTVGTIFDNNKILEELKDNQKKKKGKK